jgi:hypothetical protein
MAMEVTRSRDAYVNDGLLPVIRALSGRRAGDSEQLIFNQLVTASSLSTTPGTSCRSTSSPWPKRTMTPASHSMRTSAWPSR